MGESFEAFVRRGMPELLRFGTALTGNRHDAADLAQTALEAMARRWRRINDRDLVAYAKRAMTNAHISRWRRLRREHLSAAPSDLAAGVAVAPGEPLLDEQPMWAALAELPPRQRAVLVLRYYEDLSEAGIAEVLGCAPGTVKSQASKALATLRARLGAEDPVTGPEPPGQARNSAPSPDSCEEVHR